MEEKNNGEERKVQDWNSLWLFFFFPLSIFFFSPKEGREKEATGDLLDYQCDAHGLNEPWEEGGRGWGVKGKGVGVKRRDWCVHFLPSLLVGSRRWIFTQASPFFCTLRWGAEKCAKTPPTTAWKSGGGGALTPASPVNWGERQKRDPAANKAVEFTGNQKKFLHFVGVFFWLTSSPAPASFYFHGQAFYSKTLSLSLNGHRVLNLLVEKNKSMKITEV